MNKPVKALCAAITLSIFLGTSVVVLAAEEINENIDTVQEVEIATSQQNTSKNQDNHKVKNKDKKSKKNENEKIEQEAAPPAPVFFDGDDISFDSNSGDVYARGNVIIIQEPAKIITDEVEGNTKTNEVWIKDWANIKQPNVDLNGHDIFYNYQQKTGKMGKTDGVVDKKFIHGENVEVSPEMITIYNGTITKCPAKKPDYRISAEKIEVWPNDKLIAYNAKFWVKDVVIYSTKKYTTEIGENREDAVFPEMGYNSSDGFFIKQTFTEPIGGEDSSVSAFFDFGYYTKHDLKNSYGFVQRKPNYTLLLQQGHFMDDDDEWIKKEPELKFNYATQRIGDGPWKYDFEAIYGKWKDEDKSSWHQDYTIYFSRDVIKLSDTLNLYVGAGYEIVKESYDHSQTNSLKYDVTFVNRFSDKLTGWSGYHYTQNNNNLFDYDSTDVAKELASGINYKLDDKNSITLEQSYDLENKRVADMDYTLSHDLHCWGMDITYREKRDEWKFMLKTKHWF
ncbi:LPS-assembly protein LptD [Anaerosinus sp.]|uniref:LPS-assembly protein LptD n=1 Tax=Selenobaculum sp. TaxID=3074374 RepID=UPI0015AF00BD